MNLVAALAVFYLAYCVVRLSPSASVFRVRGSGREWQRGECLVLASLWPRRIDVIGEWPLAAESVSSVEADDARHESDDERGPSIAMTGGRVDVIGRTSVRPRTADGVDQLPSLDADEDRELQGEVSEGETAAVIRSLSLEHARARIDQVLSESRYLGISNALYMVTVFLLVPVLVIPWEENAVWLLVLPIVAALHLASTLELWRLHGHLPEPTSEDRFTEVLTGFLFPPALLRSRHDLVQRAVSGLHPAAMAAALLSGEPLRQYLAGELAYLDGRRNERRFPLLAVERKEILDIAAVNGWSETDLLTPRTPRDPVAACHCPRCSSEYVMAISHCSACGSRMLSYSDRSSI